MLANTLNTNEIKNAAGTEVEFQRISQGVRSTEYSQIAASPMLPYRLNIKHTEIGTGSGRRRRTVIRFDKTQFGDVAATENETFVSSAYMVTDLPVGAFNANTEFTHVIANLMSFCASLGASTTILYDGTGNGAQVALTGGL